MLDLPDPPVRHHISGSEIVGAGQKILDRGLNQTPEATDSENLLYSRSIRKNMSNKVSNKAAILAVGEELRLLLHEEEPPLIKDRRYHFKTYEKCFVGNEMVDWLLKKGEVESRSEAVAMMQKLVDNGVVHHVCDDHWYKDDKLFYRFRKDDGSYDEPADALILDRGQQFYSKLKADGSNLIQDRKYHFTTYKQCFLGKDFVDWLLTNNEATSRSDAVEIGKKLLDVGVFRHVCDDHHFKDEPLFFRFKLDDKIRTSPRLHDRNSKKGSRHKGEDTLTTGDRNTQRESGSSWASSSASEPPSIQGESFDQNEYMLMQSGDIANNYQPSSLPPNMSDPNSFSTSTPSSVPSSSYFETHPTPTQVRSAGHVKPSIEDLTDPGGKYYKKMVNVVSDPVGYGFVIRGSMPVYVHTVDPSGPAAAAGLMVNDYLYSINGQIVLQASHTDAARIILMGTSTAILVVFSEQTS